jgi:para-nitrobenzyl esterase
VVNVMVGSENCLTMNVFAPAAVSTTLRPVMVWIYGGGFTEGSATDDSPASFAADNNTVAVSFNYRLGPLGFLALPSLAAESPDHTNGDEGLLDQQAALRWVHQNIAAFGGDPGNVTIFGESAGGISGCAQLVSPAAAGLFEKAITESGPCTLPALSVATAEAEGSALAAKLGCGAVVGQLACMRSKPEQQVIEAMPPDPGFLFGHGAAWDPVADGVTLPTDAVQRLESGRFHRVPMIVGANRDEGRLFVALEYNAAGRNLTDAQWASTVDGYFGPTLGPKVQRQYPLAAYPDAGAAFGQAVGDAVLACPAVESARLLARFVPVYEYEFEQTPNPFVLPTPGIVLGAFHSSELPYVFDGPVESSGAIVFTPAQQKLAPAMHDAWARFAATGNPSGGGLVWPRLTGSGSRYLALDTPITVQTGMLARQCAFWARSGFSLAGVVSR